MEEPFSEGGRSRRIEDEPIRECSLPRPLEAVRNEKEVVTGVTTKRRFLTRAKGVASGFLIAAAPRVR
jgi:hypothetical protein